MVINSLLYTKLSKYLGMWLISFVFYSKQTNNWIIVLMVNVHSLYSVQHYIMQEVRLHIRKFGIVKRLNLFWNQMPRIVEKLDSVNLFLKIIENGLNQNFKFVEKLVPSTEIYI